MDGGWDHSFRYPAVAVVMGAAEVLVVVVVVVDVVVVVVVVIEGRGLFVCD